jgi:hypothetical protein
MSRLSAAYPPLPTCLPIADPHQDLVDHVMTSRRSRSSDLGLAVTVRSVPFDPALGQSS